MAVPSCDRARVVHLPQERGIAIHHLSHSDVAEWIGKCNRYTSQPDRRRTEHAGQDLTAFAHARIDHWAARTKDATPGGYPAAVGLLRAVYDIVDRLKTWEEERDLDGTAAFAGLCAALDASYAALPGPVRRAGVSTQGYPSPAKPGDADERAALRARIAELRARCDAGTAETERLTAALSDTTLRLERAEAARMVAQRRIEAIETSTSWRATAGARRLADQAKRLARHR